MDKRLEQAKEKFIKKDIDFSSQSVQELFLEIDNLKIKRKDISLKLEEKLKAKNKWSEYVNSREEEFKKKKSSDIGYIGLLSCIMSAKRRIEEADEWIIFLTQLNTNGNAIPPTSKEEGILANFI